MNAPIVGMAATPDCGGYWLAAADGGIFTYGDATFKGSAGNLHLNAPIVGMAATPDGHGYWLAAADGGIFTYGDATFKGSGAARADRSPVAGMARDGAVGYDLVAADGSVTSYSSSMAQALAPASAPSATPALRPALRPGTAPTAISGSPAAGTAPVSAGTGSTPAATSATPPAGSTASQPAPSAIQAAGFVTRNGSNLSLGGAPFRFSGTNMYWLALDDNIPGNGYPTKFEIDDAMSTAQTMGATVVRAWANSVGCAMCIEPSLGNFNPAAFQSLDYAVASAQRHGIHLVLTLADNWSYFNGGKTTYTAWRGMPENAFFSNPVVIGDYEAFIKQVLTHVNPYTGVAYQNDPTIMGWETGNEMWCQTCGSFTQQKLAEASWTNQIATYIKTLAPRQLVVDGLGVQASCQSNCLNPAALSSPAVDIVDDHFYPMDPARLAVDSAQAAASGKAYVVGEYDWANHDGGSSLAQFLSAMQSNPVAGDLFWVMIPHDSGGGFQNHNDGFQFMYSSSSPDMVQRINLLRAHAYAMAAIPAPAVPLAAPPLIQQATSTGAGVNIKWLGSAGALSYTVQRSNPSGGWTTVAAGLVDGINGETQGWTDTTSAVSPTSRYRMASVNLSGAIGAWSAPVSQG